MAEYDKRRASANLRQFLWGAGTIGSFYLAAEILTQRRIDWWYVAWTVPLAALIGVMVSIAGALGIWVATSEDDNMPRGVLAAGAFLLACSVLVGFGGDAMIRGLVWVNGTGSID